MWGYCVMVKHHAGIPVLFQLNWFNLKRINLNLINVDGFQFSQLPVNITIPLVMIIDLRQMFPSNLFLLIIINSLHCLILVFLRFAYPSFFSQNACYEDIIEPDKAKNSCQSRWNLVRFCQVCGSPTHTNKIQSCNLINSEHIICLF